MTPHGKTNHGTHIHPPVVLACLSYPDGESRNLQQKSSRIRHSAGNVSRRGTGFARSGRARHFGRHTEVQLTGLAALLQERGDQGDHDQHRHADQRPASDMVEVSHKEFHVSVRFVALRRGVSWVANQQHDVCCRQISGRTKVSAKISGQPSGEYHSAISLASHRPVKQNTSSPRKPAAIRDRRAAGCAVSVRLPVPSMPSWPISSPGSNDRRAA